MLHVSWQRMFVIKELANIAAKMHKEKVHAEKVYISISSKDIFEDFQDVVSSTDSYRRLFAKLFEEMERFNFKESASVTDSKFENKKAQFENIKLYEHTINTFNSMLKILGGTETSQQYLNKDIFLIIALLHDFGKSHALCEAYDIDITEHDHWVRSADYFIKLINEDDDLYLLEETTIKIIHKTLFLHHTNISKEKKTDFLSKLIEADKLARDLELKKLELVKQSEQENDC